METCMYLDRSNKRSRSILDGGSRPLCKNVLKHAIYYTTNHKMVIIWWCKYNKTILAYPWQKNSRKQFPRIYVIRETRTWWLISSRKLLSHITLKCVCLIKDKSFLSRRQELIVSSCLIKDNGALSRWLEKFFLTSVFWVLEMI